MAVRLQFEGIRCFAEPQDAVIRPITLLVGENSSGKTTFLALCRSAHAIANGLAQSPRFNEEPFWLGAYEQIASHRGGRNGRAKSFWLTMTVDEKTGPLSLRVEYVSRSGQPSARVWRFQSGGVSLQATNPDAPAEGSLLLESSRGRVDRHYQGMISFDEVVRQAYGLFLSDFFETPSELSESDIRALAGGTKRIQSALCQPYAFAPVRSSPLRTYDPIGLTMSPGGSHVPMFMATLSRLPHQREWEQLRAALNGFGSRSGLFEEIEIIDKGRKESDPFQVGVKSGGPAFNLIDVGYGVSQALPILVDTLQHGSALFLLQQPEVHLHPRAQAELGSFFARQATEKRQFIVETHSDYLVDRIRMDVRRKILTPEDVSLLYFERGKSGATIHNLELNANGSITNPPPGFRQFFLKEERDLLGI